MEITFQFFIHTKKIYLPLDGQKREISIEQVTKKNDHDEQHIYTHSIFEIFMKITLTVCCWRPQLEEQ